jgi:hypothetical protein
MKIDCLHKFPVSISIDAFADKKISGAMIGSTKNAENRKIRKEYGFAANKGIGFKRSSVTSGELLEALLDGHVFCHLFNPTELRADGSFGSSQKKDDNFYGSYVIGVDIDHTRYNSAEEFVERLSLKPTFFYTSYSNMQVDEKGNSKGARFRLIYVFDTLIKNPYFFRYCAYNLNKQIELDTEETIDDDCNIRCSQYFNGTNKNTKGLILSKGITNIIYSLEDINVSTEGFIEYLKNYCNYKTYNKDKINDISKLLFKLTNHVHVFNRATTYYTDCQKEDGTEIKIEDDVVEVIPEDNDAIFKCSERFVCDMQRLEYDEFMKYNRHKYPWIYRLEKDEWIDGVYQEIDDDYFSLYYNVNTVKDGQKRRKKLFERMCLRRILYPSATADILLFNAYEDVYRFFEVDKDLTIDCLVKNVEIAMRLDVEDIKKKYSKTIEYLKSRRPKSGIIIRKGVTSNIAERNKYLKNIRWSLIGDYYDCNLTVKENLDAIKANLFEVSERTIYRFCEENGIKTDKNKLTDDEVMSLLDINLSVRKNLENLKNNGIKINNNRVSRLLNIIKTNTNDTNIVSGSAIKENCTVQCNLTHSSNIENLTHRSNIENLPNMSNIEFLPNMSNITEEDETIKCA